MAALTNTQRAECLAEFINTEGGDLKLTKADLRAALNAADDWANTNAASYNLALTVTARNTLTAAQKARLLAWVVLKRYRSGV